jgi:hypothetical protein
MTLNRDAEASLPTQVCDHCQVPMRFVFAIPRVTEPGRVQMFQCERCEKMTFRPEQLSR